MATKRNHARTYRGIPAFLRELRKQSGLTQVELAKRMGVSQIWVSRSESGSRRVDIGEFVELVKAIGGDPAKVIADLMQRR